MMKKSMVFHVKIMSMTMVAKIPARGPQTSVVRQAGLVGRQAGQARRQDETPADGSPKAAPRQAGLDPRGWRNKPQNDAEDASNDAINDAGSAADDAAV